MASPRSLELFEQGRVFVDLSSSRVVEVSGSEAQTWLNDLVSAEVGALEPGHTRRSLFLARTGGVLAGFTVARSSEALYLVQDPAQPLEIDGLLAPYVLSSDVDLHDRTGSLAIISFPERHEVPAIDGTFAWAPSCLGLGVDLVGASRDRERLVASLEPGFAAADPNEVEAWRVARGLARLGVDSRDGDLPQECGLEEAVAYDKGCFVGQEAVAKTRNLGHPRRLLLRFEADDPVAADERVQTLEGGDAGAVTSVAEVDGRHLMLARVAWRDRDAPLRTASGVALRPRSEA